MSIVFSNPSWEIEEITTIDEGQYVVSNAYTDRFLNDITHINQNSQILDGEWKMKKFKFVGDSLEMQGLQEGDKVECIYSDTRYFTVGKIYPVEYNSYSDNLFVSDDLTIHWSGRFHSTVWFKPVFKKTKHSDFKDALEYLDTFGIPAEVTDKGMHIEGELTKVQWLDFAKILLEGEE